jgi:hypothetical protein
VWEHGASCVSQGYGHDLKVISDGSLMTSSSATSSPTWVSAGRGRRLC